jgi:molybdenum cofactor cytidylyltransferase
MKKRYRIDCRGNAIFMTPNNCLENSSCIILSGGMSGRMGRNKNELSFSTSNNFLEQLIDTYYEAGIKDICVVINPHSSWKIKNCAAARTLVVKNYFPEKGRLYSIQSGLMQIENSRHCFIQNVDSPFISHSQIKKMYMMRFHADWISPVYNEKRGHPILASSRILEYIRELTNYELTLKQVLLNFKNCKVESDDTCLVNINTPEDYNYYFGKKKNVCELSLSETE